MSFSIPFSRNTNYNYVSYGIYFQTNGGIMASSYNCTYKSFGDEILFLTHFPEFAYSTGYSSSYCGKPRYSNITTDNILENLNSDLSWILPYCKDGNYLLTLGIKQSGEGDWDFGAKDIHIALNIESNSITSYDWKDSSSYSNYLICGWGSYLGSSPELPCKFLDMNWYDEIPVEYN